MEPLKNLLNIYKEKEIILKHYLPESSTKHLENHEYVYDLDTLFLNDRLVFIKKSTGEIYKKGVIIKLTEDKITIKNGMNISLPKNEYYLFRYLKKNSSKKQNRKFYEELLKSLA
jgi:hypothetical protein